MSNDVKPTDFYRKKLAESVHFSLKTVNTTVEKGGIRLAKSQALDLPYISARTLLDDDLTILTDYQGDAPNITPFVKVIKPAFLNEAIEDSNEFKEAIKAVKSDLKTLLDMPFQSGLNHINVRMRQLLIPKDENYISISPISAGGVSFLLNQEVSYIKSNRDEDTVFKEHFGKLKTAVFGIGGSKDINAGMLAKSMQRPLYLTAPVANEEIRNAFRLFYKGLDYYIPSKFDVKKEEQSALIKWAKLINQGIEKTKFDPKHQEWYEKDVEATSTTMDSRTGERVFLAAILRMVLAQGKKAHQTLKAVQNDLPKIDFGTESIDSDTGDTLEITKPSLTPLLHPKVPLAIQGLIDPSLRDEGWLQVFSEHLTHAILRQSYQVNAQDTSQSFILEDNTKPFLARTIRALMYQFKELNA